MGGWLTRPVPVEWRQVIVSVISYRCPDCGQQVETPTAQSGSANCETYESVLCPSCWQLHCVNAANGEIIAEDELGDPW
jgi:DNA-directed RNA polymerase subunit RPC12/RpoP